MATHFRFNSLRLALVLALAFGAVSAAILVPQVAGDTAKSLSAKDRIEVFETVWKDIRDTYYDPEFHGVNWAEVHDRYRPQLDNLQSDAALYELLNHMAGELHDAHTRVSSPEQWENRQKMQGVSMGFTARELEGKVVVSDVRADSDAAKEGVEPGMIVASVDGQPIAERLGEVSKRIAGTSTERLERLRIIGGAFAGPAGGSARIGLERPDGSAFVATLIREVLPNPPDVRARTLPSGDGYIRFDGFQIPVEKEFREALSSFHDPPGLVIDLRWNGGGRGDVVATLAGYFYDKPTVFSEYMTRKDISASETSANAATKRREFKVAKKPEQLYTGPIVILTDTRSASSSELFAGGMQETGRAKVVGSQTCGCVIGISQNHKLKGGGVLEVSQILWFTPGGRKLEGDGVIPDVAVAPTIADLQQKHDVVLESAEKLLHSASSRSH